MMGYAALRAEQAALRAEGHPPRHRLCELHRGHQPVRRLLRHRRRAHLARRTAATVRLDADRRRSCCQTSVTEQGQGTEAIIAPDRRRPRSACRSSACASSPATPMPRPTAAAPGRRARRRHRRRGGAPGRQGAARERRRGRGRDAAGGAEVARHPSTARSSTPTPAASACRSRSSRASPTSGPTRCRPACRRSSSQTRHFVPKEYPFAFTNGIQASYLEVDVDTGFVRLLKHWVVEDCGTIINPQLVDEQVRGGVVQGLGGALYEHCLYDEPASSSTARWRTTSCRWRAEMPDIEVGHVETPTAESELGAKGAGEAGTAGAAAAVMNAVNDALAPLGTRITDIPITPERVLKRRSGRCSALRPLPRASRRGGPSEMRAEGLRLRPVADRDARHAAEAGREVRRERRACAKVSAAARMTATTISSKISSSLSGSTRCTSPRMRWARSRSATIRSARPCARRSQSATFKSAQFPGVFRLRDNSIFRLSSGPISDSPQSCLKRS